MVNYIPNRGRNGFLVIHVFFHLHPNRGSSVRDKMRFLPSSLYTLFVWLHLAATRPMHFVLSLTSWSCILISLTIIKLCDPSSRLQVRRVFLLLLLLKPSVNVRFSRVTFNTSSYLVPIYSPFAFSSNVAFFLSILLLASKSHVRVYTSSRATDMSILRSVTSCNDSDDGKNRPVESDFFLLEWRPSSDKYFQIG